MSGQFDAIVVGAGPAGSTAAVLLARRGRRVLLIDRAEFPRSKLCTHAIMPAGLPVLNALGILDAVERAGAQRWYGAHLWINGVQFSAGLPTWKVAYPYGLSLRRDRLDALLLDAAEREPGVEVRTGQRVSALLRSGAAVEGVRLGEGDCAADVHGPLTLLAGGRISALVAGANPPLVVWPNRHTAYIAYLAGVPRQERPGLEGYYWHGRSASLLPADNGLRVAGVMAPPGSWPSAGLKERLLAELRRFPPLRDRLAAATVVTRPVGVRGLRNISRRPASPGLLLIGDAGLQTDPLFGQGISWALRSAAAAAAAANHYLSGDEEALRQYAADRTRIFGHRFLAMAGFSLLPPGSMIERLVAANATLNPRSTELLLRFILGFGTVSRADGSPRTLATWLREAVRSRSATAAHPFQSGHRLPRTRAWRPRLPIP